MPNIKRSKFNNVIVAFATITFIFFVPDNNGFAEETSKTHIIEIRDLKFVPNEINVRLGDIIQWKNQDFIPHTATANNKKWNSELIDAEAKWKMTIGNETFKNYFCLYHPGMKGKIRILK